MPDYILREAVLKFIADIEECKYEPDKIFLYCQHLRRIPAADVVPIVPGKWVSVNQQTTGLPYAYRCSECGNPCVTMTKSSEVASALTPYCGGCGAHMDGTEDSHAD